ncbi:MAG: hypothetical protein SPL61_10750 [Saccharofermentans sp.]|nr:hypothetical protein [Saccharofermentans sp.]
MKKLIAVIVLFAMILSLSGCQKIKVKMLVKEYRSGFGITGQDFSGYREYEVKNIKEGDVIVGGIIGSDFEIATDEDVAERLWIMKIGEISDEGVVVTTRKGTMLRTFGTPVTFESLFHMDDGPNYDYEVIFRY